MDTEVQPDFRELLACFNARQVEYLIVGAYDRVIPLGVPPVRVDIVTSLTGVAWEEAVESSVPGRFGDVPVRYVGRDRLIDNKRAVGRKKDLADVEALGG